MDDLSDYIARNPEKFNARQQPVCGVWSRFGGPCVCGDRANHEPGGRFYRDAT